MSTTLTAILIGPMAAGKTAVGRELARRLGEPFADLDALIVESAGKPIPRIFAEDGEEVFRDREARLLAEALATRSGVLALGGGAPMRPQSGALLRRCPVVLLEVDEETAGRRLRRGEGRPLLAGDDPMQRWREISAQRMPTYRDLSRWQVASGTRPPSAVARTMHQLILEHDEKEPA